MLINHLMFCFLFYEQTHYAADILARLVIYCIIAALIHFMLFESFACTGLTVMFLVSCILSLIAQSVFLYVCIFCAQTLHTCKCFCLCYLVIYIQAQWYFFLHTLYALTALA